MLRYLKDEFKRISEESSRAEHREYYSRVGVDQPGGTRGSSSSSSLTPPDLRECAGCVFTAAF